MRDYQDPANWHPAANIFPLIEGQAFDDLVEDIRAKGLLSDIVLHEDLLLDGRNRLRACVHAGVKPRYVTWTPVDGLTPVEWVISHNLQRRHLTSSQKAACAVEALPLLQDEAAKRRAATSTEAPRDEHGRVQPVSQQVGSPADPHRHEGQATQQAAKTFQTNREYVAEADRLRREDRETFEAVKAGKTSLKAVKKKRQHEEARKQDRQLARSAPGRSEIRLQDGLTFLASIAPESIDLLLTDPPCMTEVADILSFAALWVPSALDRLKPTGRAYVFTGSYPEEIQAYVRAFLAYQASQGWTLANVMVWAYTNTIGPKLTHDYKHNWQAIWYLRGPKAPRLQSPILKEQFSVHTLKAPDGRLGDRYHTWQKPEGLAKRFIKHSTTQGATLIDPFAGTGTFLIAGAKMGRHALGCDHDPAMIKIALERGVQVAS
jgi:DNA methylase